MQNLTSHRYSRSRSGNMLVYILGAILLMGILIMLVKGSFQEGTAIDGEQLVIKASQVQQYAGEIERAVGYVLNSGYSEADLRFATNISSTYGDITNDPKRQIFVTKGGGVEYKSPPSGVNDGTAWQFFATTHFTDMGIDTGGSQKAELIAVLPNVTQAFCSQINRTVGQSSINLASTSDPAANGCVYQPGSEFQGTFTAGGAVNLLDNAVVTKFPAKEACVKCSTGQFHYYKVLMTR